MLRPNPGQRTVEVRWDRENPRLGGVRDEEVRLRLLPAVREFAEARPGWGLTFDVMSTP